MDDPSGYGLDESDPGQGTFVVQNGALTLAENEPHATILGNNPTQNAAAWDVNENDTDGADCLQTVAGDTVDSISAWDTTQVDNAAQKMRGRAVTSDIDANLVVRSGVDAAEWQIHVWRMYANAAGTTGSRLGWIGTWLNATTPELGVLWDPGHGTWPNNYILVSEGLSAWPTFNSEEDSGISRTSDSWVFVMWAGRTYTLGVTDYYDRVIVVNGTVLAADLFTTTIYSPPTGARFGCVMDGDFNAIPAYFDSYKVWQGLRYPSIVAVALPDAKPPSMTSVEAYTVSTTTTGTDRGGAVSVFYRVSNDGGATFGAYKDISLITSETFQGDGEDVIRLVAILSTPGTVPVTGVYGLFAPLVNQIQLEFLPSWREKGATAAAWTEVA